nr:hypothetical protein [Tanacetum cinerariifolium]
MFLNVEQLDKQLDKEDFQKIGSMAAFNYTKLAILEFRDTLIQHMESVKKSIDEKALHKREYDSLVNERQMQTTEEKDTSSRSGNDAHADDADIKPIYDEEPIVKFKEHARFSSNDMVHNHYLEEAKIKTQERSRNLEPSLMPSARSQSTTNGSKPTPRSNTQTSRNWPAVKNSFVTTKPVPIVEHSRNSQKNFDSKHFVCSTCQKCVFDANHDSCLTKFLKEVNSRAKVPSILRYDGDECDKGRMPTKIELTLEQSQQGVSNDVLVSIEGVEE